MAYKIIKVKRQTRCRKCGREVKVRKHMINCSGTIYCLLCGGQYLEKHRNIYKRRIADINKAFRNLRRYDKERVVMKIMGNQNGN